MALYGIVFLGSTPIGAPIAGVIGEHLGARVGFILSGAVAAGLGVALLAIGRAHSDRLGVREGDEAEAFAAPAIPAR